MIISLIKKLSFIGILTFFGLFWYFYKSSGKFRHSIISAFAALTVYLSPLASYSVDSADAFGPKLPPHQQSRVEKRNAIFGGKSDHDGSGPGKPDDPGSDSGKAGFKELPDSKNFLYDMDQGRGLKKQAEKVWKNKKAKEEIIRMLERFGDENADIQEKCLKDFKKLTELKNSGNGPRILIYRGKK